MFPQELDVQPRIGPPYPVYENCIPPLEPTEFELARNVFIANWGFDPVPFFESAILRGEYAFVSDTDPDTAAFLTETLREGIHERGRSRPDPYECQAGGTASSGDT